MLSSKIKELIKIPYFKLKNYLLLKEYGKRYEEKEILENRYRVLKGTMYGYPDYDDAWLYYLSNNSSIVFDVGCHMGKSALLISNANSLKLMVLIDPNPLALSKAAENLIINNIVEKAMFISKAAWVKTGEKIKLWTMPGAFSGASVNIDFTESGSITKNYFDVETITLDEIAINYNFNPDLIKIDVEGVESSVLMGATEIAKRGRAKFIIEVHSCENLSIIENTQLIINWCNKNDYSIFYLSSHEKLENTDIIKHRGRFHVLLIPKSVDYPEGLNRIAQGSNIEDII